MDMSFHIQILEQLDVAIDHLAENNPNSTRYAFFLIDNAAELILRTQATNKRLKLNHLYNFAEDDGNKSINKLENVSALLDSNDFKDRLNGLEKCGALRVKEKNALLNLHSFRNRSFHSGDKFPGILRELSVLYLKQIPPIIDKQRLSSLSNRDFDKCPLRIKKYMGGFLLNMNDAHFYDFEKVHGVIFGVYETISEAANTLIGNIPDALACDHKRRIDELVSEVKYVADSGPFIINSEDVILSLKFPEQTFTHDAEVFILDKRNATSDDYVRNIKTTYRNDMIKNPLDSWKKTTQLIKSLDDIEALDKYCRFFDRKGKYHELLMLAKKHSDAMFCWEDLQLTIAKESSRG